MSRLFRLLSALLIIMLTCLVSAIVYGQQQPSPTHAQAQEFEVCDGRPCFWNIVAGVTPLDLAGSKISAFMVMESRRGRVPFALSWMSVRGNLYWDEQSRIVTGIGLAKRRPDSPNKLPTLLELTLLYGEPCAVQAYSQSVMVIFPHIWMNFPREGVNLTLASRPEMLVYENVNSDLCTTSTDASYPRQSWQGVAAFDRYPSP